MSSSESAKLQYTDRWFCYLDLLGFSDLVHKRGVGYVIPLYEEVLKRMEKSVRDGKALGVLHSWFSDTFIIYSRGGTAREFGHVERASRLFFQQLILNHIPVRGALTFGKLYSNVERNTFVGPALIDAHYYGEAQRWLGLLLTPNVYQQLEGTELDLRRRSFYRPVDIADVFGRKPAGDVYAFAFNDGQVNGRNQFLKRVREMRQQSDARYRAKYYRTEKFIRKHAREKK